MIKNLLLLVLVGFVFSCGARKTAKSDFQFLNGWYFVTDEAIHTNKIYKQYGLQVYTERFAYF